MSEVYSQCQVNKGSFDGTRLGVLVTYKRIQLLELRWDLVPRMFANDLSVFKEGPMLLLAGFVSSV